MKFVVWFRYSIITLVLSVVALDRCATGTEPPTIEVLTGNEQAVVEQYVADWKRPEPRDFACILDFVHAVLMQRGEPTPDADELMRKAVQAMSRVVSEQAATPTSQKEFCAIWLERVQKSGSFAAVLQDKSWASEKARQKGIDTGMRAMLGTAGWLIPRDQAEMFRKMMAARKQETTESSRPPASFVLKRLQPSVLYLKIPTFEDADIGQRIVKQLRKELTAGADGVLIDLRDNPGGQPEQANAIADVFLDKQTLQIMRFRDGQLVKIFSRPGASEAAVVVLVNRNTGSAAEILAMAISDNDRGTLIGQRTAGALYGKDIIDLPDGRMVIFRCEPTILSASKANYADRGIPPDKVIDAGQAANNVVIPKALEMLQE